MNAAAVERRLAALAARLRPAAIKSQSPADLAADLGLTLDDWQREALASTAPQLLINASRQSGKSTTAAILGLHAILARPNALVLAVSPTERQSKLLLRTIVRYYRHLPDAVPAAAVGKLSLELANGSAVHALPGSESTIRGFSAVSLLLLDEASRIPDELYQAVRPMLAVSGGRLVTMSTPWGKRGFWWEAWSEGGSDWLRFEVPASSCPRISPAFLESERRAMPAMVFASEYECQFTEPIDGYFRHDDIAAAFTADVEPLFPLEAA